MLTIRRGPFVSITTLLLLFAATGVSSVGAQPEGWQSLFDGKSLGAWRSANFGGEGEVKVANGVIQMEAGAMLTGVTWTGAPPPKMNYEISVEARKTSGSDFFCALTFPVADSHCSLIVGGWGGSLVGLSSLDDRDASENETSQAMDFVTDRWYRIRVRVTKTRIEAWIDDKALIDAKTADRKISIRPEVDLSRPLGIASWQTGAELREIRIRRLE